MGKGSEPPRGGPSSPPSHWLVLPAAAEADAEGRERCAAVYRRFRSRVRGFLAKRISSPEECRELTQEVFVRVFRQGGRFGSREAFEAWLFAIAGNVFRNALRDRRAAKRDGAEESLEALMIPKPNPGRLERRIREETVAPPEQLTGILELERRERLLEAVGELPARMRSCLWLQVFQGRSNGEIARVLRISADTVKTHLRQARSRLREKLASVFEDVDF